MQVRRVSVGSVNGFYLQDRSTEILFDPPAQILDGDSKIRRVSRKSKYIEIEVLKEYPPTLTAIFLSNSNSLGVFFTESKVPVYLTDIVYLQLKEKLKNYLALGPVRVNRNNSPMLENGVKRVEISEYKGIDDRVRIISFLHSIPFTYFTVTSGPAGICLGWPLYLIKKSNTTVLVYSYGAGGASSLALEMNSISEKTPLILNKVYEEKGESINKFNEKVLHLCRKHNQIAVTLDVMNCSIEIALHLLSVVKEKKIFVCHRGFKKLVQLCEIKRHFLSKRVVAEDTIAFSIFSSSKRLETRSIASILSEQETETSIIICEPLDYSLFFSDIPVIHLEEYSIKMISSQEDVLNLPWVSQLYLFPQGHTLNSTLNALSTTSSSNTQNSLGILRNEGKQVLNSRVIPIDTTEITISDNHVPYSISIENNHLVQQIHTSEDKVSLYFRGVLKEHDNELVLECEEPLLQKLAALPKSQKYYLDNSVVYDTKSELIKVEESNGHITITKIN
ncbi:hypothetical protein NEOKW01_1054 [Nematocida sp. AWRm80]|nr:hypothetical protein NEOKW01_1054 [Nematocida sp. AWRm80]